MALLLIARDTSSVFFDQSAEHEILEHGKGQR